MRSFCFASLLVFALFPLAAQGDDTLVLDIPPINPAPTATAVSAASVPQANSGLAGAAGRLAASTNPAAHVPTAPNRHGFVDRTPGERVIGKLGVAAHTATIRSGRNGRGRLLAQIRPGTYLALTNDLGSDYGVLMQDKTTGWLPKSAVNVLSYEVVAPNGPSYPDRHQYPQYAASRSAYASAGQQAILNEAYRFLGVPYKWGGESANGLDCSAFVRHCFETLGVRLPRTAHEQAAYGAAVPPENLQAADRLYFASRDGRITHTGIYIGDGYFIHSSSSRGGVAVSRLDEPLYRKMFCGARRGL